MFIHLAVQLRQSEMRRVKRTAPILFDRFHQNCSTIAIQVVSNIHRADIVPGQYVVRHNVLYFLLELLEHTADKL